MGTRAGSRTGDRAIAPGTQTGPSRRAPSVRARLVALDATALLVSWLLASALTASSGAGPAALARVASVSIAAGLVCLRAQRLYVTWVNTMRTEVLARLLRTAGVAGVAGALATASLPPAQRSLALAPLGAALSLVLLFVGRWGFNRWLRTQRRAGRLQRPVLLAGTAPAVADTAALLEEHGEVGFDIVGWIGPRGHVPGIDHLGRLEDALVHVRRSQASGVVLLPSQLDRDVVTRVATDLVRAGVHVHLDSSLAGISYRRLAAVPIAHEPFVHLSPMQASRLALVVKRVLDVVGATFALLVTAPLLAGLAVAIKLQDGGPVLFRQQRVGLDGARITIHKLRTMVVDAEARLPELLAHNERNGPLFKLDEDPRETRLGRVLRKASLDELPQLFDVLRGVLSLVGPRPALPSEVAEFDEALLARLRVRPGITGLWQVEARDSSSFAVYRRLDLFYVENWSLSLDLAILLDSIPAVLERAFGRTRSDTSSGTAAAAADAATNAVGTDDVEVVLDSRPPIDLRPAEAGLAQDAAR